MLKTWMQYKDRRPTTLLNCIGCSAALLSNLSNTSRYVCQTRTKFIGCCTSDPCGTGCFGDRLRPAGVSTAIYNQYPGGSCGGSTLFWTCLAEPTFWGCCNSNPCQNNSTCAVGQLEPTFMTRDDQIEYFGALNVLLSSTLPSATSSPSVSATASLISAPSSSDTSAKISGAVIGGAIGGSIALLGIIGMVILFLCRRKRHKQKSNDSDTGEQDPIATAPKENSNAQALSPHLSDRSRT